MPDLCGVGHHVRWLIVTRDRFQIIDGVIRNHPRSRCHPSARFRLRIGMPAPIRRRTRQASMASTRWLHATPRPTPAPHQDPAITHLSRTLFSRRSKSPDRPPRAPAGGRAICVAKLDGAIVGIVPCYLKSHSQGEYVFDRGWADAYERAGGRYYPKLQASVPFTPATGPRLLIRDGVDQERIGDALASGLDGAVRRHQGLIGSRHLCAAKRNGSFSPTTASCSGPTSSSTGTIKATTASTISSRPSIRAIARRSSASGARRWPPNGITHPRADRQRHHRRRLGRVLRFLHGDRLAQMGPALSDPRVLLADRREHAPRTCCW